MKAKVKTAVIEKKTKADKTLLLFEDISERSCFYELEGDYSRFNNVYINAFSRTRRGYDELCDELNDLIYTENGKRKLKALKEPTKNWTWFIKCGFVA